MLTDWGVTANKDLVLDLSGIGKCSAPVRKSPSFCSTNRSPITRPLTRVPTAFPLPRSLDDQVAAARRTVEKLFGTTEDSIAVTEVAASGAIDPKKGKKGPFTLGASGYRAGLAERAASSWSALRSGPKIARWVRARSAIAICS